MKDCSMMPYTESGITLELKDLEYFCFENCEGYRKLSAYHFREMDIGWYDSSEDTLYLVELKDFTLQDIADKSIAETIALELVKKSIDFFNV